jgi:murein DD-endopeptidase MepM/ murein hydrolase activator NlpD
MAAGVMTAALTGLCLVGLLNAGQASAAAAPTPSPTPTPPVLTCPTVSPAVTPSPVATALPSLTPLLTTPTPSPFATTPPGVLTSPSPSPSPLPGCDPSSVLAPVIGGPPPTAPPTGPSTGNTATTGGSPLTPVTQTVDGLGGFPASLWGQWVTLNPALAGLVGAILDNPIAQQAPDLRHFSPPLAMSGANPASGSGPSRLSGAENTGINVADAQTVLTGLAVVMALLALVTMVRRVGVLAVRSRMSALLPPAGLVLTLSAAAAGLGLSTHAAPTARAAAAGVPASSAAPAAPATAARTAVVTAPAVAPEWSALVAIETTLASERSQLVADETQIGDTTRTLAQPGGSAPMSAAVAPAPATATPSPTASAPGAGVQAVFVQGLGTIVADHQQLLAQYQQTLQAEYSLFVSLAQSPAARSAVRNAAASLGAAVADSVDYDLNAVQTQLAQEAAISSASSAPSSPTTVTVPASAPLTLHAPLSGVVSQAFGWSSLALELPLVYGGVFYPHFHTGLDIAAPADTPVGAAAAGRVIFAGQSRDAAGHLVGYGNYVMVEHGGGVVTLYGHLDQIAVAVGDAVQQGQVIGLEGSTGWSTGPHVHFEVRLNGMAVDPAAYLAGEIQHPAR